MKEGESHFFDRQLVNSQSIRKYEASFKPKNKKIIGEKTPSYCYLQHAMNNIYKYNQNIKLVIILREPIQRAYSHYTMDTIDKKEDTFMNQFVTKLDIKPRGFYDIQLEYILSKFPRNNVYIGISEEIRRNKQVEYNKIFKFLGAKEYTINDSVDTRIGTYKEPIKKEDAKVLYDIYRTHTENVYKLLGRRIQIWEEYYSTLFS